MAIRRAVADLRDNLKSMVALVARALSRVPALDERQLRWLLAPWLERFDIPNPKELTAP